jgi:hypothetical protein
VNFWDCSCRLNAYDRNQDFRGPPIILPETVLVDWPNDGFRTLNIESIPHLPPLSYHFLECYFTLRMGLDKRAVGDAQAIAKGKQLLHSKRVVACSYVSTDGDIYFTAICRAAMKKGVRETSCLMTLC